MRFQLTRRPEEFAARAWPFLEGRLECNVMATVLKAVQDGVYAVSEPLFAYGLDDQDRVGFAALRTPPWFLLSSELDPADAPGLMTFWLASDPDVPGVSGLRDTARGIAAAWRACTGGQTHCRMREAMHRLTDVSEPPRPAPGFLRPPDEREHDLVVSWVTSFAVEAGIQAADQAESMARGQLASDAVMLWDHGGPVCLAGIAGSVAGVARIAPVYTPPEHRGRGYASSAVAALSRRCLEGGARSCILYTDLANPTSNRIYADVGYRRFAEWEEHAFER